MVGSSNIHTQKRQRLEDDETRCATLRDLDVLDCPICCEPLTVPIFQCDINGHLACHTCCPKLKNKCPACTSPIDKKRNRAMEKVLESAIVPCRNTQLGCTVNVPYGRVSNHEKEYCRFSLCSCPEIDVCNYSGYYDDIYLHHLACHDSEDNPFFDFGVSSNVQMRIRDKILVRMTFTKKVLFVMQCFSESDGVYVNVNCIAPLAPEVEKFSYRISYSSGGHTLTHESLEMKRIRKVSFQIPQEENFLFISNKLLRGEKLLKLELCISEVEPRAGSSSQMAHSPPTQSSKECSFDKTGDYV